MKRNNVMKTVMMLLMTLSVILFCITGCTTTKKQENITPSDASHEHEWTAVYRMESIYETIHFEEKNHEEKVYAALPVYKKVVYVECKNPDCSFKVPIEEQVDGEITYFPENEKLISEHFISDEHTKKELSLNFEVAYYTDEVVGTTTITDVPAHNEKVVVETKEVLDHYECECGAKKEK